MRFPFSMHGAGNFLPVAVDYSRIDDRNSRRLDDIHHLVGCLEA